MRIFNRFPLTTSSETFHIFKYKQMVILNSKAKSPFGKYIFWFFRMAKFKVLLLYEAIVRAGTSAQFIITLQLSLCIFQYTHLLKTDNSTKYLMLCNNVNPAPSLVYIL